MDKKSTLQNLLLQNTYGELNDWQRIETLSLVKQSEYSLDELNEFDEILNELQEIKFSPSESSIKIILGYSSQSSEMETH